LLRWLEGPQSCPREEYVEIIEDQVCQTIIRSSLELSRETEVTLIGKDYTEHGIVQACESENTWFLLTLRAKVSHRPGNATLDPGALMVDDFLSEEQEAAILAEVSEEVLVQQALSGLEETDGADTPSLWHAVQPGSTGAAGNGFGAYTNQRQPLRH
jgi:hypothetical protein